MSRSERNTGSWGVLAIASVVFLFGEAALQAQDFRVDTDVYLGDDDETYSEHLTLFRGAIVYDFSVKGPEEITILNLQNGEITLLDVKRKLRADLTTKELLEFSARIKAIGTSKQAEDLVAPKFTVTFDESKSSLELVSNKIVYRASGSKPSDPLIADRYREFTDWYARLNSMRPPNPPHFGRLELNSELASRGLLPQDIERTITHGGLFSKPQKARSHHAIGTVISGTDRRRIDEAGGYLVSFSKVTPAAYMQLEKLAAQ
ncbi:MAG: hypothetical protein H6822_29610 [Planctomycetaceae bacterium]|nr:hypothetical protein [Planctomycetales bacterium]MCB9926341.1 hypothetical protein [Planctomycetaceae bacterium]